MPQALKKLSILLLQVTCSKTRTRQQLSEELLQNVFIKQINEDVTRSYFGCGTINAINIGKLIESQHESVLQCSFSTVFKVTTVLYCEMFH